MDSIITWLLNGDVSLQYLTHSLLLDSDTDVINALQERIETEGYGAKFLSCRNVNGHWGNWFYQPKWTSTHYTLVDMKSIGMPQYSKACREMATRVFDECMLDNGGISLAKTPLPSDVAVDGMILDYASYFCPDENRIERLVEYILNQVKPDGGYSWDTKAQTSDPHTTICVLEGFHSYKKAGFKSLIYEVIKSEKEAIEYLLSNELFIDSDDSRFRRLSFPYRYRYDLLRALEYFALEGIPYDRRMAPALNWLDSKRKADGHWILENVHKGKVHFELEQKQKPSRFITLKALYIKKVFS